MSDELSQKLDQAKDALQGKAGELSDLVSEHAPKIADAVQEKAGQLGDKAGQLGDVVKERASGLTDRAKEIAKDLPSRDEVTRIVNEDVLHKVQESIETHPVKAAVIAFFSGAIFVKFLGIFRNKD